MNRFRWLPFGLLATVCVVGCATSTAFPPSSVPPYVIPVTPDVPVMPIQYPPDVPAGTDWGHFRGQLRLELVGGRDARLSAPFSYVDPRGTEWSAPRGSIVNGASIPQAFWSFIGGPWDGAYRQASVVHDVACESMHTSWQDTHRMFYEACRCGGVDERTAKMMYWAVYHFGPRWASRTVATSDATATRPQRIATMAPTPAQLQHARSYFQQNSPDIDAIPSLMFPQ